MICVIWLLAVSIAMAPVFGWKDSHWQERIDNKICLVSQDVGYQMFATISCFYVPLAFIIFLYSAIYRTAVRIIHRKPRASKQVEELTKTYSTPSDKTETTVFIDSSTSVSSSNNSNYTNVRVSTSSSSTPRSSTGNASRARSSTGNASRPRLSTGNSSRIRASIGNASRPRWSREDSFISRSRWMNKKKTPITLLQTKRENKAAKTFAVITGAFIICWLPFFIVAFVSPLCSSCYFDKTMESVFLWLGYMNSTLNPFIYTIFSPDFRFAFKKLICGKKYVRNQVLKKRRLAVSSAEEANKS